VFVNTDLVQRATLPIEQKIDGVVIGVFLSIAEIGAPLVAFPGNPLETAIPARSTTQLGTEDVGKEVALLFEGGDPKRPLIIGKIHRPDVEKVASVNQSATAEVDGEHIVLAAQQTITLKCGKASITLTKAGKIILRGTYVLSRSSGVNCIKGGSVQLN
jgi:hypothetical protein